MEPKIELVILVDNYAKEGLSVEHGFSIWITAGGETLLLDTGQSDLVVQNAELLGCDLAQVDALILSHGHYDHSGGVAAFLQKNHQARFFYHPEVFRKRYSLHPGKPAKSNGMSEHNAQLIRSLPASRCVVNSGVYQFNRQVGLTGAIPRVHPLEDVGGPFFLDKTGNQADNIEDDQALWIQTDRGLIIITGCCHAGVINTVNYVREVTGEQKIRAVIGGFHLHAASDERLEETIKAFREWQPEFIVPCHCTGKAVSEKLRSELGCHVEPGYVGWKKTLRL